ncbi:MAG: YihY/virulence factor BrkB family protein [Bacilli bacterium]|nr:YihY/virulence factor BrkB family protein [Bacilli bacterium]
MKKTNILNKIKDIFSKRIISILPGNLAFGLMLSIVPIFTLILIICNSFGLSLESIMLRLKFLIPDDIINLIIMYVNTSGVTIGNILLMLAGFYSASIATSSLMLTSDILYNSKTTVFVKRKTKALIITILLIFLVIIALLILAFGNYIVSLIISIITKTIPSIKGLFKVFTILKWPISLIVLYFVISLIYILSNNNKLTLKDVSKGSLFASLAWCLTTLLFTFYIENFTSYDIIYGSLSSIIVLLIWIYILSYILVIGIAINTLKE